MKISEILKNNKPTISFEFFPPRSEKGWKSIDKTIDELVELKPDFVSVTFSAGGSSKEGSYQLVKKLKVEKGLDVLAYVAAYALKLDEIDSVLNSYKDIGIENIFALRGDASKQSVTTTTVHPESFNYASELIPYIRENHDFCIGAAGYPEGHIEAVSIEKDIEYLKNKVDKGAEYIIANFFYDNQDFLNFRERCQKAGINVPILPGIMPVYSVKMLEMLTSNCGASIPEALSKGISQLPEGDKDALVQFGIDYATKQCQELLKEGVPGLHLYTMDRSESLVGVVDNLRNMGALPTK